MPAKTALLPSSDISLATNLSLAEVEGKIDISSVHFQITSVPLSTVLVTSVLAQNTSTFGSNVSTSSEQAHKVMNVPDKIIILFIAAEDYSSQSPPNTV